MLNYTWSVVIALPKADPSVNALVVSEETTTSVSAGSLATPLPVERSAPEPFTFLLLGSALLVVGLIARRRRANHRS